MNNPLPLVLCVVSALLVPVVHAETESPPASGGEAVGGIEVVIGNFSSEKGNVIFRVYSGEDNWLGDDMVFNEIYPMSEVYRDGVVALTVALPDGEYAFSVIHDENGNEKLDTNFIGIPKEPGVVSNSAPAKFGPPKYEDARFLVEGSVIPMQLEFN